MAPRHAIDVALDLVRMPTLARTAVAPPIPPDVIELMRIAAANPQACKAAADKTGEPMPVLVDAARFYLQQVLFRPEADCYRVLGIERAAPRATARSHMRWLLQWLHPDHNTTWDAVYAERVVKAWREVSAANGAGPAIDERVARRRKRGEAVNIRLPWIERPVKKSRARFRTAYRAFIIWAFPAGVLIVALALWSATYYFGPEQTGGGGGPPGGRGAGGGGGVRWEWGGGG
jgi:hypothetical protein